MADFIASSIAGSAAIVLGNPIDVIKVRLQTGITNTRSTAARFETWTSLFRGAAAPVLGNGALTALLFVGYNRTLEYLESTPYQQIKSPSLANVWLAGAASGLACFIISAPTEVIKCRAQIYPSHLHDIATRGTSTTSGIQSPSGTRNAPSSWRVARQVFATSGVKGLYHGGVITSLRDSIGYGWYFWAYEATKNALGLESEMATSLVAGGIAGCVTWASIYPFDVVKTRVQTQSLVGPVINGGSCGERDGLLGGNGGGGGAARRYEMGAWDHTKAIWRTEGVRGYFSGFWWCMGRSFFVNAVQWALYEYIMRALRSESADKSFETREQEYSY
ncbi:hypothetical protein TWF225_008358 [Orbilia oligospora]|uniref:Uncharacterized protein n=1 Tax=Orbilia oligospora TaxID=2813651 RepID=A0A7C8K6V8_ORBOL|nr:hypothetical protein TWF751_003362 [Orbilia oligospora]KAF3194200.1 hypothetical protein TWF225_008358 [Orbilia oligospora]KAF3254807.1 hypothetical protein TWF128_006114 [Orbilia oligospora]KAF3269800.1 hypothetical protein TWF217_008163 [Orbilia oligospora]KAF3278395.1 hypothetical protein TWF132_001177 [Orbilia oligospora]